jgi:exopolysaccharide production protein ExoQ
MRAAIRNTFDSGYLTGGRLPYGALAIGILIYATAILTLPLLQPDEQMAIALLLLAPALLIGVYIVTRSVLGDRLSGMIIAVACIFISAGNFRARAYDDKSIDLQVGVKLLALALFFVTAGIFLSYAFNRLQFGRLFYAWLLFFAYVVFSALYSVSVPFALMCSISFLVCYIYAVYMTVWLSRIRALEIMIIAALLMCVGSIFVYFAIPSMGRMQAWTGAAGMGDTGRMKGLTGSANAIGMIAAFAIIPAILYYREFGSFGRKAAIALIPSALVSLILSGNRSSMIAVAGALWFAFVFRRGTSLKLVLSITGATIGGAILLGFSDEIFSLLSRSGKADEITSATGRSLIWSVVIEFCAQRPIFGYGYTSALQILPLDPRLFLVAAHAHNMFLEMLFAGGVVLLMLFAYATYQMFLHVYRLRAINEGALFVFFLIRGLTEAGPFGGMTGYTSIAFAVTIALVISKSVDASARAPMMRPVTATRGVPRLRPSRV